MNNHPIKLGENGLILEGIVTTRNEDGTVNISPMGPIVDVGIEQLLFRPYQSSTTYKNLMRTGQGVFHLTDDVLLLAQAAVGQPCPMPKLDDLVLVDACRWFEFKVCSFDDSEDRAEIVANTILQGRIRDFIGFNRAKHAVVEAAILATRVHLVPREHLLAEMQRLELLVAKTASSVEKHAFSFLRKFVEQEIQGSSNSEALR